MLDIVERLRTWVRAVDAVPASDLMDEAASAIERLRRVVEQKNLTDAERDAVAWYAAYGAGDHAATLRSLLSRTGSIAAKTGDNATECCSQGEKTPERDH